jgi:hypothetical protein
MTTEDCAARPAAYSVKPQRASCIRIIQTRRFGIYEFMSSWNLMSFSSLSSHWYFLLVVVPSQNRCLVPFIHIMDSEVLTVERLQLSNGQIHAEKREDQTQDLLERSPNWRDHANNHRPISHFNRAWQESNARSDSVARSKFSESVTFTPKVPTSSYYPPASSEGSGTRQEPPRPSSENCLSTAQTSHSSFNTPLRAQNAPLLCPDFADPKRVPGTNQNIYPRAPISPDFYERYAQLVDFFKQAVDIHKCLKHHTSKINYELRLCGSTPADAVASIIVFCTEAIFKQLRSLLNSRHIRRQYQLENASVRNRFSFTPNKPHPQVPVPAIIPFKVVFWREATTPTQRRATTEQVIAQNHSFLTMCGSLVRHGDRTSTLGLLISVDSKLYGLTVDHLFNKQKEETQSIIAKELNILSDENDTEDNREDWPWVDDVTYEDMDNDQKVSDTGSVTSGRSYVEVVMDQALTEHYGTSISGHKLDSVHEVDPSTPYLDWALINFEGEYFERPNVFYSEDNPTDPKFLTRLSATPETSGVPVFMISGVSGTRKGVMLNGNSYVGGKFGENLCQTWNVILSGAACEFVHPGRESLADRTPPGVIDGDCGSLIVNQETLEVYGHVVASNPLGEAYVVPLRNIFRQIHDALGAKEVSLPNPGPLTENLVTHYSKTGGTNVTHGEKLILAAMAAEKQFEVETFPELAPRRRSSLAVEVADHEDSLYDAQVEDSKTKPLHKAVENRIDSLGRASAERVIDIHDAPPNGDTAITAGASSTIPQPYSSTQDAPVEFQDSKKDSSSRAMTTQQGRTPIREIPPFSGNPPSYSRLGVGPQESEQCEN